MLFKDLKVGSCVYFLDKDPKLNVGMGKVINTMPPHFEASKTIGQPACMMVDLTIERNGKVVTYSMTDTGTITYAGLSTIIATEKEAIIKEVESMKEQAIQNLSSKERNENIVSEAEKILTEWNPQFRERKETEERFKGIENQVNTLADKIDSLLMKLS